MRWPGLALLLLALLLPASGAFAEPPPALARLASLVGSWETPPRTGGPIRISYRFVAGDSALVQTFVTPSGKETLTIFHADGPRVLATHYCGQGNQPRLQLDPASSPTRPIFVFVDATNLATPAASHLIRLELRLDGAGTYTQIETYETAGQAETSTLTLHRSKAR